MGNMSAADMFALSKREHESLFSDNIQSKRNNTTAKMIANATLAASVMLTTQLEAKELDENDQALIDGIETSSLSSNIENSLDALDSSRNAVDAVLGSAKSEFALLNPISSVASTSTIATSASLNNITSEAGLPLGFVTQSLGVSDPAQPTNAINSSVTKTEPSRTNLPTSNGQQQSSAQANLAQDGIDGNDGTNGLNGSNGRDGANGNDGLDGSNGGNGLDRTNGLTTIYLNNNFFEGTDILEALTASGFEIGAGPLGSTAIVIDPARLQELIDLFGDLGVDENFETDDPLFTIATTNEPDHGSTSGTGTENDDFISGDESDNVISGFGGDDHLSGGTGADTLLGGEGVDTADYRLSEEAVQVNISTQEALFGDAEGDILVSIENLAGSANNDILTGDDGDNRLTGRDGDDVLSGGIGNDRLVGGEGADRFNGGEGDRDAADFNLAEEAVGVDLLNGGFMGEALGDSYSGIEFIVGSEFHDILLANDEVNRIDGGDGCDVLNGRGGNDTLLGGEGGDVLNGGEGNDVFIFEENSGYDIIEDFEAGNGRSDRVWLQDHDFDSFEDIQEAIIDTNDGAVLTLDTGTIIFQGISSADFAADDFILA